jgi:hypothetical protein
MTSLWNRMAASRQKGGRDALEGGLEISAASGQRPKQQRPSPPSQAIRNSSDVESRDTDSVGRATKRDIVIRSSAKL